MGVVAVAAAHVVNVLDHPDYLLERMFPPLFTPRAAAALFYYMLHGPPYCMVLSDTVSLSILSNLI
eukprot:COSAG05_NODE_778_length_7403_cov_636.272180_4_plen_66_part_00